MKKYILLALVMYLVIINVLGFILMHVDKKQAKKRRHARRIPELVLLIISVLGGSIGIMAGMEIFRHKTKHKRFFLGIPITLLIQVCLVAAFYYFIL